MESHSMRRRQTVLGEQLQAAANSSQSLASVGASQGSTSSLTVPGVGSGDVGVSHHMRSFSRLSARFNDSQLSLDNANLSMNSVGSGNQGATQGGGMVGPGGGPFGGSFGGPGFSHGGGSKSTSSPSLTPSGGIPGGSTPGGDLMDPALINSSVDPLSYLSRTLAGADAAAVLAFGEKLRALAQRAQESEQRSVQRNYKALRSVANGVAELPPAVAELDRQIADLSAVTDAMRQDAMQFSQRSQATPGTTRRTSAGSDFGGNDADADADADEGRLGTRQSMMVLNNTWMKDLNGLYQRVEGAQRVLPPAPGRHLVLEESGWLLLNLVTRKPVKPVLLVLLNDFFMVAAPHHGRFAYERHWPLEEQLSCDIDEQSRVLRVRAGNAGHFGLLAPSPVRLRAVYAQLTKLNELAAVSKQRVATRSRVRASGSMDNGFGIHGTPGGHGSGHGGNGISGHGPGAPSGPTASIYGMGHSRKISTSSVTSAHDATIEERREAARVVADIDREMAHRRWSTAVEQVVSHSNDPVYGAAVAARKKELESTLLFELSTSWHRHSRQETAQLIQMLVALGHEREAKQTLLETAAADIEAQSRSVNFMGDVVSYISQMAAIYFQTILATVKVYQLAFNSKSDSSRIVAWAKSQVDLYAAIFNRQLFRIAPEFKAYQRCREVSRLESSQLKSLRMDMEFMLRYVWEN